MNTNKILLTVFFIIVMVAGVALLGVGIPSLIQASNTSGAQYNANIRSGLAFTIPGALLFLIGYKFF